MQDLKVVKPQVPPVFKESDCIAIEPLFNINTSSAEFV